MIVYYLLFLTMLTLSTASVQYAYGLGTPGDCKDTAALKALVTQSELTKSARFGMKNLESIGY